MMKFPFEADPEEISSAPESYVDAVFSSLSSEFFVMPKGEGFLDYPTFSKAYESLKSATKNFKSLDSNVVFDACVEAPVILIVLRTMLGLSPPEWAYAASERSGIDIPQGAARTLDRDVRSDPDKPLSKGKITRQRVTALVETACQIIEEGCPQVSKKLLHRLDKADSKEGLDSVRQMADIGAPYAMLLYERFLGRPFAAHRDSVSELVGDVLESAIEDELVKAGVSYRKTKRAERIPGFDQAPDFIIPDEFNPKVIIEAKITEDDGTARDKVARILRLCEMSSERERNDQPGYQVIACLAGRGFKVRREDMRQMILNTKGKIFTLKTLSKLVQCSDLDGFRTKS
jgi:hypothetical protein